MDPLRSKQDVLRCNLCETSSPTMYCDICDIHLCKACVGGHLLDESKFHKVVPFKKRGSTPICSIHSTKLCELYCERCENKICALCVSSGEHEQHKKVDIWKKINDTKADLQNDLKELEETILSKHEAGVSQITVQIADFEKNSRNLKLDIDKKGEELHKEIDNIIKKLKEDIDAMDSKQRTVLNKHKNEFTRRISEIKKAILDQKNILNLHDFNRLSAYKSRNAEFRKLPPKATVSLPSFTSHQINKEQINQQFGVLSALSIKEE